jgi:hypothetical protein
MHQVYKQNKELTNREAINFLQACEVTEVIPTWEQAILTAEFLK